jgi:hypothetical protein
MLALKATLLSLREALEVATVALDKALTAKAEEVVEVAEVVEVVQVEQVAEVAELAAAEEKAKAVAGQVSAWAAWTAYILKVYPKDSAEFKTFLAKRVAAAEAGLLKNNAKQAKVKSGKKASGDLMDAKEAVVGAHIPFVSWYREQNWEEWLCFKAQWEADHPKLSRTSSVTGGASEAGSALEGSGTEAEAKPKRGRKLMTQEQKDAAKAKREAKKAAVEFDPLASQWA